MKCEILGVVRKTGEYNGRDYDNVQLHCVVNDPEVKGKAVSVYKVRSPLFFEFLDEYSLTVEAVIGKRVSVSCDRFGRVDELNLVPDRPVKKSSEKKTDGKVDDSELPF